jgi:hypothetical protein
MAEVKRVAGSWWPYKPLGGWKVKLHHDDIQKIADGATPVATITALIPGGGAAVAATISLLMWLIKRIDKKHGYRGVVICSWGLQQIRGPDAWWGDD